MLEGEKGNKGHSMQWVKSATLIFLPNTQIKAEYYLNKKGNLKIKLQNVNITSKMQNIAMQIYIKGNK